MVLGDQVLLGMPPGLEEPCVFVCDRRFSEAKETLLSPSTWLATFHAEKMDGLSNCRRQARQPGSCNGPKNLGRRRRLETPVATKQIEIPPGRRQVL